MSENKSELMSAATKSTTHAADAKAHLGAKRKNVLITLASIGLVVAIVAGISYFAAKRLNGSSVLSAVASTRHKLTLEELRARVEASPYDATAHRDLGDALFESHDASHGLSHYTQALKLDDNIQGPEMLSNIVSCFGRREQKTAERLLVAQKLVSAAPALEEMTGSKRYEIRWGAVETLQKLGKVSRPDYVHAYVADLETNDCALRRHAVEKLGTIGDSNVLPAVEAAAKKDQADKHWYWFSCLGDRPQRAIEQIRTRSRVGV